MSWVDVTGDIQFEIVNDMDSNTLFCGENVNNIVEKKEFGSQLLRNFIESDLNMASKKEVTTNEKNAFTKPAEMESLKTIEQNSIQIEHTEKKPIPVPSLNKSLPITSTSVVLPSIGKMIESNSSMENHKKQELIAELLSIIQKILSL